MNVSGKLDIHDVEIKTYDNHEYFVRLIIGDYMYLDTPYTTKKNATVILKNIIMRLEI